MQVVRACRNLLSCRGKTLAGLVDIEIANARERPTICLSFQNVTKKGERVSTKSKNDAKGMRGDRARNKDGRLRDKRNDTLVGTIEKKYNIDLGVRSDMKLGTYLQREGIESLNDLINDKK